MKNILKKGISLVICLAVLLALFGPVMQASAAANANPSWNVDERVIFHAQCTPYDYYAAKDPTIVYYGGKYLVYYTGANQSGGWQMCFTSASTISGLKTASRTYMSKIGESYFCAPELFYYEPQSLWYLVYQDGTYGAAYATSTNPADPNSWSGPKSFGISGNMGWDYYIICDDQYAYMYNTPDDGSGKLYMRKTALANFPNKGWSTPTVACSNVFEASAVYKSLADGQYYLLVEAMINGRSYELFTSSSAGGPWTLINNKWATSTNLTIYNADKWTTNVSHGELIRAGYNQKLEINDINRVDFLIQGTTNLSGDYQKIVWDLGLIRNYTGSPATPTPTPSAATPTPTPTPSAVTPTPTPSGATATPTPTPTPTPSGSTPAPGGIKVQFFNGNTAATTNTIYPNFKVVNTGTSAINLSDVKVRYYFTNDGTQANSFACDYSTIGAGNVTGSFTTIAKTNADRYLEVGFTSAAGTLGAGASAEVKGRIWKSDWSNFTQTNDYSFNATATNYVDSATVTGYLAGALKWGTEP